MLNVSALKIILYLTYHMFVLSIIFDYYCLYDVMLVICWVFGFDEPRFVGELMTLAGRDKDTLIFTCRF